MEPWHGRTRRPARRLRAAVPAPGPPGDLPGGRLRDALRRRARDAPRPDRRDARQPPGPLRHRPHDRRTLGLMAAWLGVELDESWPEDRQRELVKRQAELARRRGTRRGLEEALQIAFPDLPLRVEEDGGVRPRRERRGAAAGAAAALRRLLRRPLGGARRARPYDRDHEAGARPVPAADPLGPARAGGRVSSVCRACGQIAENDPDFCPNCGEYLRWDPTGFQAGGPGPAAAARRRRRRRRAPPRPPRRRPPPARRRRPPRRPPPAAPPPPAPAQPDAVLIALRGPGEEGVRRRAGGGRVQPGGSVHLPRAGPQPERDRRQLRHGGRRPAGGLVADLPRHGLPRAVRVRRRLYEQEVEIRLAPPRTRRGRGARLGDRGPRAAPGRTAPRSARPRRR